MQNNLVNAMSNAMEEDDSPSTLAGMCDPRQSRVCWWDGYDLKSKGAPPPVHAVTSTGLSTGAFCSEACANAWSQQETRVHHSDASFRPVPRAGVGFAPPQLASKRFGGELKKSEFRAFNSNNALLYTSFRETPALLPATTGASMNEVKPAAASEDGKGYNTSYLCPRFFRGFDSTEFASCDPRQSRVCWWDGGALLPDKPVVRTTVYHTPAKVMFVKDRYRFSESVAHDYETRTRNETYVKYGAFCSRECRLAWLEHEFKRDPRTVSSACMYDEALEVLDDAAPAAPRPDRLAMQQYGGFLSQQEFLDDRLTYGYTCSVTPYSSGDGFVCYRIIFDSITHSNQ
jgi:hypothetical protein